MNFFKSVFADEPELPKTDSDSDSSQMGEEPENPEPDSSPNQPNANPETKPSTDIAGAWSFGSLIKTLATKSESVIDTYRRDLQEFGTGLKKEIEVAQGSLETVTHAIDEFGSTVLKGTAQIISQGKDAILAADNESDSSDTNSSKNHGAHRSLSSKRYSRFESQISAIQGDANTYCEEPEDVEEYRKWKLGFVLDEKREEMKRLLEENGSMESVYNRVVPNTVDQETFWSRYFYKVHKLKQAEDVRANLVKRAISREEEEELSWDVDDDEMEDSISSGSKMWSKENEIVGNKDSVEIVESQVGNSVVVSEVNNGASKVEKDSPSGNRVSEQIVKEEILVKESGHERSGVADENVHSESNPGLVKEDFDLKSGEKSEGKAAASATTAGESSNKSSENSVIASQASVADEEDMGWDEIEDLSSIDEKKVTHSGSPNRAELRKRLSAAEEDEDLSWDIDDDDDDEPAKA